MYWQTSRRKISLDRPLVMGILNITPDSFSDGGAYLAVDDALRHAEQMIQDGADIIDIGGESTRPGSKPVEVEDEINRVIPVIEAISKRFETPISVDTTKSEVAEGAIDAGAEIINDVSGLRFDEPIADVASRTNAGIVLMHSRGSFATMHTQPPMGDIVAEVNAGLHQAIDVALKHGISNDQIILDVGIGFGKTKEQNLELLEKLDKIVAEFKGHLMLVGTSRKSFLATASGGITPAERLSGSLATALLSAKKGANILRVHDVRETVAAVRMLTQNTLA